MGAITLFQTNISTMRGPRYTSPDTIILFVSFIVADLFWKHPQGGLRKPPKQLGFLLSSTCDCRPCKSQSLGVLGFNNLNPSGAANALDELANELQAEAADTLTLHYMHTPSPMMEKKLHLLCHEYTPECYINFLRP